MQRGSYFIVAGLDLEAETDRLCGLPAFASGRLAGELPALRVRRARRRPQRLGFAIPSEWRISVTAYPGIRRGDAQETLLHELVHLHVGSEPGHRRWHGPVFKEMLRGAMAEAYGIADVRPSNALHGAYAEALEAMRARRAATDRGTQLELRLTA